MTNKIGFGFGTLLGSVSLFIVACAAGDTIMGDPTGGATQGGAGTTGAAGTTGSGARGGTMGNQVGAGGTVGVAGRGGTTGVAGTSGAAGTTGVTGNAGTTGARGGTTGAAGVSGAAGTTGSGAPMPCVSGDTRAPAAALITDFSDTMPDATNAGQFRYGGGMATRVNGGTSTFKNPMSTAGTLSVTGGALTFTASVSTPTTSGADQYPYNGFVVYVDGPACVNASAYSAVGFTLSSTGNCSMVFAFGYADTLSASSDTNRGLCTGTCYPSQFTVTAATTSVPFTSTPVVMGMPVATVNKMKLTGVQWQMQPSTMTAGCTGTITVDNIMFIP